MCDAYSNYEMAKGLPTIESNEHFTPRFTTYLYALGHSSHLIAIHIYPHIDVSEDVVCAWLWLIKIRLLKVSAISPMS